MSLAQQIVVGVRPLNEQETVSELVAFVFRDQFRAPEVLNELRRRKWGWVRDLDDAVALSLNEEGKAKVYLSVNLSDYDATAWPRLWGSLFSTALFITSTETMVQAASLVARCSEEENSITPYFKTCEAEWWRASLANSGNFKRDVAALMASKGSAIFMLVRFQNTAAALEQLGNYGDTILHTTLSSEQDHKLLKILARCREAGHEYAGYKDVGPDSSNGKVRSGPPRLRHFDLPGEEDV